MKRQEISDEVWDQNYRAPGENTVQDTWKRLAKACSDVEPESVRQQVYRDFLWLLEDFKGCPGGRISANLGVEGRDATSLINCFTHGPTGERYRDPDSIEGIYDMLKAQAHTLKSEGGYGVNFSWIRPAGTYVKGIGGRTPGVLKFMELWDLSSKVITMGSENISDSKKSEEKKKMRKGAMMAILLVSHPEILDFIDCKLTKGRFTKFNISVGIVPGFMEAVVNDLDWNLEFPDATHEKYEDEWTGDLDLWKSKGFPVVVYKTIKARYLWEKIMHATYTRNEPGVMFFDIANKLNPLKYAEKIDATNPCFHGDERFLTENGYVKFKDSKLFGIKGVHTDNRISYKDDGVSEKPENWKIDLSQTGSTFRDSSPAFITKEYSDLLELEFSGGQIVKCTPDHHFATTYGMVEAKDLTPDHQVLISVPEDSKKSIVGIDPETKDEMDSFLMGLIAGDGCISRYCHIDIWNDKIMATKVQAMLDKLGEKYYVSINDEINKIRISSKSLMVRFEKQYGFIKETKHTVPECIINNARTKIGMYYIAGLYYADGTVSGNVNKGVSVRLSQSDKSMLRQVQLLLHANGILSNIYLRRENPVAIIRGIKYSCKDQYELITVCGSWKAFGKIIDFKHKEKDEKLSGFLSSVKENYNKQYYVNLTSLKEIDGDEVYCIKEQVTRSIIVNTLTTRRCGEIIGPSNLTCLLFSLNLPKYVVKEGDSFNFDYNEFSKAVKLAIRFTDNINDITRVPLKAYKEVLSSKRRIGVGVVGLGSLHYILGIRYGSEESKKLVAAIFKTKAEAEILASAELGKEKGSFTLFDRKEYFSSIWWKNLDISYSIKRQVEEIGEMRNSHRSANAPTGNMSVYIGVVSGGIEPVFEKEYYRWVIVPEQERFNLRLQGFEFPDVTKSEFFETKHLQYTFAGDEKVLKGTFDGIDYQVDNGRGLTKRVLVEDYGWSFVKENFSSEKIKRLDDNGVFATTSDLTVDEHVSVLSSIAKYVDMNSSKTINIPNEYPYKEFENLYLDAWRNNIKGITSYRAGTMTAVLEKKEDLEENTAKKQEVVEEDNLKKDQEARLSAPRPRTLEAEVHKIKLDIGGQIKNAYVSVSFSPGTRNPYEVLVSAPAGDNLRDMQILELSARMTSLSLRHGVPVKYIADQLDKISGQYIYSIPASLSKVLSDYIVEDDMPDEVIEEPVNTERSPIVNSTEKVQYKATAQKTKCPSCGEKAYVREQSCAKCLSCNYSKCG